MRLFGRVSNLLRLNLNPSRESREELRLELDLKNSRLEDLEMGIHELKRGQLHDRQHVRFLPSSVLPF